MQSSSRNTPCPCCQRTRTGHCRFDLDSANPIVLCHNGGANHPPQHLRIGDTVDFAGRTWALVRLNAGHSGNSHEFRPHRALDRRSRQQYRREKAFQQVSDLHRLGQALLELDAIANQALGIPQLEMMLDHDIRTARDTTEQAYNVTKEMLGRITRIKHYDATLTPVWEEHPKPTVTSNIS